MSNRSAFPDLRALTRSRRRHRLLAKRDPYRGSAATLTAVRQNLETAASQALEARGREVAVAWRDEQTFDIDEPPVAAASAE